MNRVKGLKKEKDRIKFWMCRTGVNFGGSSDRDGYAQNIFYKFIKELITRYLKISMCKLSRWNYKMNSKIRTQIL